MRQDYELLWGDAVADERVFYEAAGLNVDTYDELTALGNPSVDADAEFYVRQAQRFGDPVLELGAGTGRVTWALAEAGNAAVGLDLSEAMLRRARKKGAAKPESVRQLARFVPGNMAAFELDETFPLVIIPFRAFQSLITPEDQRRALLCIRRHLRAGGRLIVDLFDPQLQRCTPEAGVMDEPRTVRHPVSGNTVRIETLSHRNDSLRQVLTEVWRFSELDAAGNVVRTEEEVLTMRWTYRHEMRYLFELTGFAIETEYSDYVGSPPAYGCEQVWIARRI